MFSKRSGSKLPLVALVPLDFFDPAQGGSAPSSFSGSLHALGVGLSRRLFFGAP